MAGGDPFKKVKSGDPLRLPAEAYNRMIDAARALPGPGIKPGSAGDDLPDGVVLAKNVSDSNAPRGGVGHVWVHDPYDYYCLAPDLSGVSTRIATEGIALEPIAAGRAGRVAVAGGPYRCLVDDRAQVGYRVGVDSSVADWHATDVNGPWVVVGLSGDYAQVVHHAALRSGHTGARALGAGEWFSMALTRSTATPVSFYVLTRVEREDESLRVYYRQIEVLPDGRIYGVGMENSQLI